MTNYICILIVITYSILSGHWNCSDYAAEKNGQRYHQNAHGTICFLTYRTVEYDSHSTLNRAVTEQIRSRN